MNLEIHLLRDDTVNVMVKTSFYTHNQCTGCFHQMLVTRMMLDNVSVLDKDAFLSAFIDNIDGIML